MPIPKRSLRSLFLLCLCTGLWFGCGDDEDGGVDSSVTEDSSVMADGNVNQDGSVTTDGNVGQDGSVTEDASVTQDGSVTDDGGTVGTTCGETTCNPGSQKRRTHEM